MISNKIIAKEFFMELVYLWVEDYKNIKKQGFNFSPRFRCDYDEKTNELKIVDKDVTGEFYPKNFFGDNINVTAIVGENGSGKSSIFKQIIKVLLNSYYSKDLIFIILEEGIIKILKLKDINLTNIKKINFKIYQSVSDFFDKNIAYFSSSIFDSNYNIEKKDNFNYFGLLEDNYNYNRQKVIDKSIENIIFLLKNLNEAELKDLNINFSKEIELSPKRSPFDIKETIVSKFKNHEEIYRIISKRYRNVKYGQYMSKRYFLLTYFWIIKFYDFIEKDTDFISFFDLSEITEELFVEKLERYFERYPEIIEFVNKWLEISNKELSSDKSSSKLNFFRHFWININDIDNEFLELFINFNIKELFDLNWIIDLEIRNMSSGETLILDLLGKFYKYLKTNQKDSLFFFDEIEALLHPEWQRKYFNLLIKFIEMFNQDYKSHFIFATHSPFILSDLPKENIIFLEKGKQVHPFEDGKQTFGANIHTLFSHGFFMKDGLIGEFAKSKIDDVIKYLNNDKKSTITTDKDAQNIIDIIGEPIIKRELQRMLKNKMELSNKTEIDTIIDEIKLLTERLEKLEPKDEK